jgi:hypothetical protein
VSEQTFVYRYNSTDHNTDHREVVCPRLVPIPLHLVCKSQTQATLYLWEHGAAVADNYDTQLDYSSGLVATLLAAADTKLVGPRMDAMSRQHLGDHWEAEEVVGHHVAVAVVLARLVAVGEAVKVIQWVSEEQEVEEEVVAGQGGMSYACCCMWSRPRESLYQ